jgi:aminobenzoyl-glutamate utilization protein B
MFPMPPFPAAPAAGHLSPTAPGFGPRVGPGPLPAALRHGVVALTAALLLVPALSLPGAAQEGHDLVSRNLDRNHATWSEVALEIWGLAEVGYLEHRSSALLQDQLRSAGFQVEAGVAGIPTAFVASWGEGGPVVGILAEYDALPGITQDSVPERRPLPELGAGHACGHHLFGAGSVGAAVAVKEWLESSGTPGTIRIYGTPAEEGGSGKVYMVREGLFDDVDVVLHWHPSDRNDASPSTTLANKSAKFRFHGISSHASAAPERGRSALDGVQAMNFMVEMMREHIRPESRIHYVITSGGSAPNVVPDFAEVYYYVRHPDPEQVEELYQWLVEASEGAARGTQTQVEHEVIHGNFPVLPNETLAEAAYRNLQAVGGVTYDDRERAFAERIQTTLAGAPPPLSQAWEVAPFEFRTSGGSTDVGDVSWAVPTVGLGTATWVPGTSAHSWQAVAAGGTTIGTKGMRVAAEVLARTAVDLFTDPELIREARREWEERIPEGFEYRPLLGDREPPLDYRVER